MSEILFAEFFNQRLREKGLTLVQLSGMTGITLKHLENLSAGRFDKLPPTPYLHGYLEKLGEVLGFDPAEWWMTVKREDLVTRSGSADRLPANRFGKHAKRWIFGFGAIVVLLALYLGLRFSAILGAPRIAIETPPNSQERAYEDRILFKGKVTNGDDLYLNGEKIPMAEDGTFATEIPLQPGPNPIVFKATKILGKEVTVTRQIYYDSPVSTFNGLEVQAPNATSSQ